MCSICCLLFAAALQAEADADVVMIHAVQWTSVEISLRSESEYDWWDFPVEATLTHAESGSTVRLAAYANAPREFVFRFSPPHAGTWKYVTESDDRSLNAHAGSIHVLQPPKADVEKNPNLRGHLRISRNGRYFVSGDGTPFLLLADTIWAFNTSRCGLGDGDDGPFLTYLADRRSKGFTTLLVSLLHGYGDVASPTGHRNEGGYAFEAGDLEQMNFAYFESLDARMRAIWEHGFAVACPPTWFGKPRCIWTLTDALRLQQYLMARYGSYNVIWSVAGEYQYAMHDCGWSAEDISRLGAAAQQRNAYHHPMSIHPSGRTNWPGAHGRQSSIAFADAEWLDHHWIQSGQSAASLPKVATLARALYEQSPPRPVFLSEGFYEWSPDAERAYHARWQAWTAFLNGACGYGYGAQGMWQFYDPDDPLGETGKNREGSVPWREALAFEGSAQMRPVRELLDRLPWWEWRPDHESVLVDDRPNRPPTPTDITPPHCASTADGLRIVYIPRGNEGRQIQLQDARASRFSAAWFDPRSGDDIARENLTPTQQSLTIPNRPTPAAEDWVLVLRSADK